MKSESYIVEAERLHGWPQEMLINVPVIPALALLVLAVRRYREYEPLRVAFAA